MMFEESMSGSDYIRAMFANTQPDGELTLQQPDEEPETWYMEWTQAEAEAIVARFEALKEALDRLAEQADRWWKSTQGMPEDLLAVWNTYILPYPDHGMDQEELMMIDMKLDMKEPLTQQEQAMHNREVAWFQEHALTRLPMERCNPAWLIQRARRYLRLLTLRAPAVIVNNELRCLAEEMALYWGVLPFG